MRAERKRLFNLCDKVLEAHAADSEDMTLRGRIGHALEPQGANPEALLVRLAKDFIRNNKGKMK